MKAALKDGRDPAQIALLCCPNCGALGYYNEGSHFTCGVCKSSYSCITDDEDAPDRPYIILNETFTLDDWDAFDELEVP